MQDNDDQGTGDNFHLVEFRTLKDLFSFVITKSIPGQQFLSLIRFQGLHLHVYTDRPLGDDFLHARDSKGPDLLVGR